MNLETLCLDLLLPVIIVDLDVVKNRIDEDTDVRVLVGEELKDNGNHLGLMKNNVSGWREEEELEEGIQDLLDHLVIFLFGPK